MPRSRLITWSPSVTLVPTRQCFNACDYCSFRRPPSLTPGPDGLPDDALGDADARALLRARPRAAEVLLLSGEVAPGAPGAPGRAAWYGRLLRLSHLALEAGRLPHTNAGPLSRREMAALGRLNPSMGLMLEGLGPAVDARHRHAPSKTLEQRLIQIEQAGRLGIPFTTGLLLGLGESAAERREALELLALLQRQWGHIQEVILQPWRPGGAAAGPLAAHEVDDLLGLIAVARQVLPEEVHLQLPPNLWPPDRLIEALEAGIDDLGGLDLHDVINPAYPQPGTRALAERLAAAGWRLQPRLCVHREWLAWLPRRLQRSAAAVSQRLGLDC
jgi:FO synthase subunit 1